MSTILKKTEYVRATIAAIVDSINQKSERAGLLPWTGDVRAELEDQLTDSAHAFDFLDDQEARLGLNVADERSDLVDLFVSAEDAQAKFGI